MHIFQHFQQQPVKFSLKMMNKRSRNQGWEHSNAECLVYTGPAPVHTASRKQPQPRILCPTLTNALIFSHHLSFYTLPNYQWLKWQHYNITAINNVMSNVWQSLALSSSVLQTHRCHSTYFCPRHIPYKPVHNALQWRNIETYWHGYVQ